VLSKDFARCLSFEDLATGGSFMVIGKQRDLLGMLYNFATFFRHESCGFCTPCRVGSYLIENIMERFTHGQGSSADLEHLKQICKTMQTSSFCGLGTSAPTAFMDAISSLPELFEQRMYSRTDNPFFDLQQATSDYRRVALDE
jgi:[NiFe] hydrogenase diaphorase moiety large subunit